MFVYAETILFLKNGVRVNVCVLGGGFLAHKRCFRECSCMRKRFFAHKQCLCQRVCTRKCFLLPINGVSVSVYICEDGFLSSKVFV